MVYQLTLHDAVFIPLALLTSYLLWRTRRSRLPLPPGPKGWPVLGHIFDLGGDELWLKVTDWSQQYGDVNYTHVLGQSIVFLNSRKAAQDLLNDRGAIYSDRPHLMMTNELCGCKHLHPFMNYGEQFKRQRRMFLGALGPSNISDYHPLMGHETSAFLRNLLKDTNDFHGHIRRYAGGMTLQVVYGYKADSNDDRFLKLAEDVLKILANEVAASGKVWIVDVFPFLSGIPHWMPGASFKRKAAHWSAKVNEFASAPYEYVKASIVDGSAQASFCSKILDNPPPRVTEHDIMWTANSMYAASADTTIVTASHFVLAMLLHPEVMAKAQAEIDQVIGSHRLPDFGDRDLLPYVNAVVKETFRWAVPVPLGLPHALREDDVYEGMFIPKGTLVFANAWNIMRDETVFPNAHSFDASRFVDKGGDHNDIVNAVFGFGRRICPATVDLSKATADDGSLIEPCVRYQNRVFRTLDPFPFDIKPRSPQALQLLEDDSC